MESAFAWLGQLFETFYKFIPHILIIRATHRREMGAGQAHQALESGPAPPVAADDRG